VVVDAVVGWSGVGWRRSVVWNPRRNEENEPQHSSWFVFMTHYAGLPHDTCNTPPAKCRSRGITAFAVTPS